MKKCPKGWKAVTGQTFKSIILDKSSAFVKKRKQNRKKKLIKFLPANKKKEKSF